MLHDIHTTCSRLLKQSPFLRLFNYNSSYQKITSKRHIKYLEQWTLRACRRPWRYQPQSRDQRPRSRRSFVFFTLGEFRKATAKLHPVQDTICRNWIQLLITFQLPVPRAQVVAVPAPRYISAIKMRFLLNIDATDRQVPSMIPSITRLPNRFSLFLAASCYAQQYKFYEVTDPQASPPTSSHYRSHQHLILPLISIANAFQCLSRSRTFPRASKDSFHFRLLLPALHTSNHHCPNQRHLVLAVCHHLRAPDNNE